MIELQTPAEIFAFAQKTKDNWKDVNVPMNQWSQAVERELVKVDNDHYEQVPPFLAFASCMEAISYESLDDAKTVLELGASSGYYGYILDKLEYSWDYTASDYSLAFQELAKQKYPNQKFILADASNVPVKSNSYDIVISGCYLLHTFNWRTCMTEATRIAKEYVLFHRTPILSDSETRYFKKEAYGIECLEIHFGKKEFYNALEDLEVKIVKDEIIFEHDTEYGRYGHHSILVKL